MKTLLIALGIVAAPALAFAQTAEFQMADANGDGVVSMEEATAIMPDMTEDALMAADANGDGALDETEFEALTGN